MSRGVRVAAALSGVVFGLMFVLGVYVLSAPHAGTPAPAPGPAPTRSVPA